MVFGGAGFLGRHVVGELLKNGYRVLVIDKSALNVPSGAQVIICDVLHEFDKLTVKYEDYAVVFNFIAQPDIQASVPNVLQTFELNMMFNIQLLEKIKLATVMPRYVFASSAYAVSGAGLFYGISKWAAERTVMQYSEVHGINYLILRYGSVYGIGAGESNRIYRFVRDALHKNQLVFEGSGDEEREFIHVEDAAVLTLDLVTRNVKNQTFMLTGSERYSYRQIARMISEILGGRCKVHFQDKNYGGHYYFTPYTLPNNVAKKIVPKEFKDIGQGLIEVAEHLRSSADDQDA